MLAPLQTYGLQLGLPTEPAATTVQVPRPPATLHASQLAPHEALQH